jgi:hypothetical protein
MTEVPAPRGKGVERVISGHSIASSDLATLLDTRPGARGALLRRLEINLNHGAAWKALISRYITVIVLIGDDSCIAMQSMSGWPLKKSVHNAMMANVGAAAKPSQWARPGAPWPLPVQVSTS